MTTIRLGRAGLLAGAIAATAAPAFATNGYFAHGYGLRAKGMGGVATALPQDALGAATNPATMAWVGSRLDLGVDLFMPVRDAERSGAGFPGLNGKVDSDREAFLVPELGYNRMLRPDLALGVSVYGNGGMNTSYPQGPFQCPTGPTTPPIAANMLCGSGGLGVDLMQLIVAPTVAWKPVERHSVGASLLLGYQRFKATGLQAFDNPPGFPPFTGTPGKVTNNGSDSATGAGLRVGWLGQLTDAFSVGAAYSTKIRMSDLDKYAGLFAESGGFDIPANWSVGVAFRPAAGWVVGLDWQRIEYSGVRSVANPSLPTAPLGAANGPGFGWRDIDVLKLGVEWRMNDRLALRAGYNRGDNPIRAEDVTFNILAPGVMKEHYTLGFTWALAANSDLTGMLMIAPRQTVSGPSLFNGLFGPGVGGNETIGMRQSSIGIGWSTRF